MLSAKTRKTSIPKTRSDSEGDTAPEDNDEASELGLYAIAQFATRSSLRGLWAFVANSLLAHPQASTLAGKRHLTGHQILCNPSRSRCNQHKTINVVKYHFNNVFSDVLK